MLVKLSSFRSRNRLISCHVTVKSVVLFVVYNVFLQASAFPFFRDAIPNGNNVRSPCVWFLPVWGVGHKSPFGGGERNLFGMDFGRIGTWNNELCSLDSDGDGLTNGHELGDDTCVWTPGADPSRTTSITHPGINNENPECLKRFLEFLMALLQPSKNFIG